MLIDSQGMDFPATMSRLSFLWRFNTSSKSNFSAFSSRPPPHSSSCNVFLRPSACSPLHTNNSNNNNNKSYSGSLFMFYTSTNSSCTRSLVRLYCSRSPASSFVSISSLLATFSKLMAMLLGSLLSTVGKLQSQCLTSPAPGPVEVHTPLRLHGGRLGMALLSTSAIAKAHISPVLITLKANPTFMSGLVAWMVAQASKVLTTYIVYRRWDFKMLVGSGGMPSSHSALCVGLTTSVALSHGVGDALFPVCLGFTLIVMYDATGVRRHAGMQAEVLNMIIKDLFQGHPVSEKKLKELLGHTPLQVMAGALVGILVGWWCSHPSSFASAAAAAVASSR